jgi:hypothetical protein
MILKITRLPFQMLQQVKVNGNFKNSSIIQEEGSLEFDENNIVFNYTVPEYSKYISVEYQYLLEGFQDDWSDGVQRPV